MRIKRILVIFLVVVHCSCATSNRPSKPDSTGLATVSALVIAMPAIPFALAYHAVTRDQQPSKAERDLQKLLDPVYEKRITMIEARDPVADATRAWQSGGAAVLPTYPNGAIFSGLEKTEFYRNRDFAQENQRRISRSEFLRYLQALLSKDPVHIENDNVGYFTPTFHHFIETRRTYSVLFNKAMYARMKNPQLK